jgi:hypothetical protein
MTYRPPLFLLLALLACAMLGCAHSESVETPDAPQQLIDESLTHWDPLVFGADGEVFVEGDELHLDMGGPLTGVRYSGDVTELLGPGLEDYEIAFEAQRIQGMDFFVGFTFPVGNDGEVTLIMGGWGGSLVGLSSLDHADASMNPTTQLVKFDQGRWYAVRVVVTAETIGVWIDGDPVIDLQRADFSKFSLRGEVLDTAPLGLCCFQTHAAYRNFTARRIAE